MLFIFTIGTLIYRLIVKEKRSDVLIFLKSKKFILMIILGILMAILASAFSIYINDLLIIDIPFHPYVVSVLAIFRTSGRFIWVTFYFIIGIIALLLRYYNKYIVAALMSVAFIFQAIDINASISVPAIKNNNISVNQNFNQPVLDAICQEDYDVFQIMQHEEQLYTNMGTVIKLFVLAYYGNQYDMDLSNFYLARSYNMEVIATREEYFSELNSGIVRDNLVYVFDINTDMQTIKDYPMYYYIVEDKMIAGISSSIDSIASYAVIIE